MIKVLATGTLTTVKIWMNSPGIKECEYLFHAPRSGKGQTPAKYSQNFDMAYFGKVYHYGSNLFRKKRSNKRKENQERHARELACWEDGHALATEEKSYIALPQKTKADIARHTLQAEIKPVDFPTPEEMA